MSYQVLARKWRPRNFTELVGQQHVVQALVNALQANRLHHAYLFTGTRGVGKTTIGRIFAKSLNCEQGVTASPCGQCSACVQIDQGRYIDLIEVDAASRTKVEDTRELLENVQYAPSVGQFKVYLIDEVHMLSNHSFNALLKTLEEPPPHVKFILATTDPQKLPVTILSRCLQFNLKRIPVQQIQQYLQEVLQKEEITAEPDGVFAIARAADGSMRDGLSLLDQAIAHGAGKLVAEEVRAMLGAVETAALDQLVASLLRSDVEAVLQQVQQISSQSPDFQQLLAELLGYFQQLALAQLAPNNLHEAVCNREQILQLAQQCSAEEIQLFYQLLLQGRRDLALAPDAASGFEMLMLRLLAFRPAMSERVQRMPSKETNAVKKSVTMISAKPVVKSVAKLAPNAAQEPYSPPDAAIASVVAESAPAPFVQPNQEPILKAAVQVMASVSAPTRDSEWGDILRALDLKGLAQQLAENCLLHKNTASHWTLILDEGKAFLLTDGNRKKLTDRLQQLLGDDLQIDLRRGKLEAESPAMEKVRQEAVRKQSLLVAIETDPTVLQMQNLFGAEFQQEAIEPANERETDQNYGHDNETESNH